MGILIFFGYAILQIIVIPLTMEPSEDKKKYNENI